MTEPRELLDDASFRSAASIDGDDLSMPGIYAIRMAAESKLPEPFQSFLDRRGSRLIYIGKATSLDTRMRRNERRGEGHGTFFRSLGAVLGYRPAPGSLATMKNKNNFVFAQDRDAIVDWINENLEVAWDKRPVARLEATEFALIVEHSPLLNIRSNPRKLPELESLRSLCREAARAQPAS